MEIIIVLALALLIFGPKRLPEMGRTLGRAAREFRKATDEVKGVFDIGLNDEEDAKTATGVAAVTAPTPLPSPGREPRWDEVQAAGGSPAPATGQRAGEHVPGLAGFLGVAQAAPEAGAPAAGDDGSAAPAFASFLGKGAGEGAGDPPAPDSLAPETDGHESVAPEARLAASGAAEMPAGDTPVAPEAPEAPAAAEAG